MGGTAPEADGGPGSVPWLATLTGGLLPAIAGGLGLRRSRRAAATERGHARG